MGLLISFCDDLNLHRSLGLFKLRVSTKVTSKRIGQNQLMIQDRIISLLQVMHTAKYPEIEASYKNCHMLQNKNCSCTCNKVLNPVPYFSKHSIQSYAALPVAVARASKPQLLQSLSPMLSFYRTNMEPIDQVKSNLS